MKRLLPLRQFLLIVLMPTAIVAVLGFLATSAIVVSERRNDRLNLESLARRAVGNVEEKVASGEVAIESLRSFWLGSEAVTADEFLRFTGNLQARLPGFIALSWVDEENIVRYISPLEGPNLLALGLDHDDHPSRIKAIRRAISTRDLAATEPLQLVQGVPGVVIFAPIFKNDVYGGAAVGVIRLSSLVEDAGDILGDAAARSVYVSDGITVSADGEAIFDERDAARLPPPSRRLTVDFKIEDIPWSLIVDLGNDTTFSGTSKAFAALGLLMTMLTFAFTLLLHLKQRVLSDTVAREKDFVSLVSHQLREPLTELSWLVDALKENEPNDDERAKASDDIQSIVKGSMKLITDLLDVSRIERGVLKIKKEEVPLTAITDEAVSHLQKEAERRSIRIAVDVPASAYVAVDQLKATEAIRNVIDNAVKYAPAGTRVDVSAKTAAGFCTVAVRDRGAGIPKNIQEHIFEKASMFAPKGENSGAGLGLYLTKMFIERMGGSISFETSAEGTTFFIRLPTAERPA